MPCLITKFAGGSIDRRLELGKEVWSLGAKSGGLEDGSSPAGSKGGAPVGSLEDEVPQKLNTFCNNCTRISRIFGSYFRVISFI